MHTMTLKQLVEASPKELADELDKLLVHMPVTPYGEALLKTIAIALRGKPDQAYDPKESFFIQASNVRFVTVDGIIRDLGNKIRTGGYAVNGYTNTLSEIASALDNFGPEARSINGKIILEVKKDFSDWRLMVVTRISDPVLDTSEIYMVTEADITKFTGVGMSNVRTSNYDFFPPYWCDAAKPQSASADAATKQVIHYSKNPATGVTTEYVCTHDGCLLAKHIKG